MDHDLPLNGQHAVVTGAGRGIGAAITEELAQLGANVTLMGRTSASLDQQREKLQSISANQASVILVDVASPASIQAGFNQAQETLGPVAILINNAGIAGSAPFLKTDLEHWQRMLQVDLVGPVLCCQHVLPGMLQASYGRIVNIASTAGLKGYAYVTAYTAAKHGLIGLTRALALETVGSGITVNAVCPGYTDTALLANSVDNITRATGRSEEEAQAILRADIPMGRFIMPEEVAQAVGWLCLPDSAAITGQSIVVAGGEIM